MERRRRLPCCRVGTWLFDSRHNRTTGMGSREHPRAAVNRNCCNISFDPDFGSHRMVLMTTAFAVTRCKLASPGGKKCGPRFACNDRGPERLTLIGVNQLQLVSPCYDRSPLSSLACETGWRRPPAAESFYVPVFAAPAACSSVFVVTVTAGTATAARPVAIRPIAKNGA